MEYNDYIADMIRKSLVIHSSKSMVLDRVGQVKSDLDIDGGWLKSTKKTIEVRDKNGRKYQVTIEAIQ